jgi:hypothetical protein
VGRGFCVPVAFTGNSPRSLRGEPGIPIKPSGSGNAGAALKGPLLEPGNGSYGFAFLSSAAGLAAAAGMAAALGFQKSGSLLIHSSAT